MESLNDKNGAWLKLSCAGSTSPSYLSLFLILAPPTLAALALALASCCRARRARNVKIEGVMSSSGICLFSSVARQRGGGMRMRHAGSVRPHFVGFPCFASRNGGKENS